MTTTRRRCAGMTATARPLIAATAVLLAAATTLPADESTPAPPPAGPDPAALLGRLDADGDGTLTREEFRELADLASGPLKGRGAAFDLLFARLDADRNARLTARELAGLAALRGAAAPPPAAPRDLGAATADLVPVGPPDEAETLWRHAIDPELLDDEALMLFQDPTGAIFLERLDARSGRPAPGAPALRLAEGAAALRLTYNGPEFGVDADGWSAFYTQDEGGTLAVRRAWLADGAPRTAPVFRDGERRQSVLASKHPGAASVRLIYVRGDVETGVFHWADVAAPEREHRIVPTRRLDSPRWIDGTLSFVYAEAEGPDRGQLKLCDTVAGRTTTITSDEGVKSFAYGWLAPEFDGAPTVVAMIDDAALGVWRETAPGVWRRVQTIARPAEARGAVFGSPEPVVFGGRSYVSAVLKSDATLRFRDSEVWLFGLAGDEASAGAGTALRAAYGEPAARSDPETLVAGDRLHVYYNLRSDDAGYRIGHAVLAARPAATGPAATSPPPAPPGTTVADPAAAGPAEKPGLSKLYKREPGPFRTATVAELILHDEARDKDLQVRVVYPEGDGPFPLVVFCHGATGSKDDYQPLVRHWASHGYVCLQANHSDSRVLAGMEETGKVANKFGDWASRPADVVFLLDALDAIEARAPALRGRIDRRAIGVGGHSFGAHTAQLVAGTTTVAFGGARSSHHDPRPRAFVLISPQGRGPQLDDRSWRDVTRPFLSVTGTNDWGRSGDAVDWRLDPFRLAPAKEKFLLFIDGAHHDFGGIGGGVRYRNAGPANPNHLAYVQSTTLAFWDAYLRDDPGARAYLASDAVRDAGDGEAELSRGDAP